MNFKHEGQESRLWSNAETYDVKSHSPNSSSETEGNFEHFVKSESNSKTCNAKSHSSSSSSETEGNIEHVVKPEDLQTSKTSHSYRLRRLKTENKKLKTLMICKRCNCAQVQTLTLPCCHIVCCEPCANAADDCPLCNARILGTVRIFIS